MANSIVLLACGTMTVCASTTLEAYKGKSRSAFSGKALAIVQSSTSAGKITCKATSGSLTGSSVVITAGTP
jgi:beta-galactosidase